MKKRMEEKNDKKMTSKKEKLILFGLLPLLLIISYEAIYRDSVASALGYFVLSPIPAVLTYALIVMKAGVFYQFGRKAYILAITVLGLVLTIFAFASGIKSNLRGVPILPADFYLKNEAMDISAYLNDIWNIWLFLPIIFVIVATWWFIKTPKERIGKIDKQKRRSFTELTLVLSILFLFGIVPVNSVFGVEASDGSQGDNTKNNGLLIAFMLNIQTPEIKKVENYSEKTMGNVTKALEVPYETNEKIDPNVIVILSEALWDPTLLEGVRFDEDPIPYFRSLMKTHTSGDILVPVYGGGTIDTEIEVLTGMSTEFLADGVSMHKHIDKPVDSLASLFKNQGYSTAAVHTFNGWFYERNRFYEHLGFDKFYSLEFFNDIEYNGLFAKDKILFEQIVHEMDSTEGKDFIYAPTVEGHGPYEATKEVESDIKVVSEMTKESKNILTDYANRINGFDKAFKELVEQIEEKGEPTIIAVYGDHLPMLGENESVYREFGFLTGESTYEEYKKKFTAPVLIWDNFSEEREDLQISSSYLASYVLELAGKEGSYITDYLSNKAKEGRTMLPNETYWEEEGLTKDEIEEYQNLQYDVLFGESFSYKKGAKPIPQKNENYKLGNGEVAINSETPLELDKSHQIQIALTGGPFVVNNKIANTLVTVNGEVIEVNELTQDKIMFTLPDKFKELGNIEVEVLLKDNLNVIVSHSNKIKYSIQ